MLFNPVAFQDSVDNFADFLNSGKLQTQERDYKERLIKVLGRALSDEALASPDFMARFKDALREVSKEIINLTYFMVFDDFKKYLEAVKQERFVGMLRGLFNESAELSKRFDEFDSELHRDYDTYIAPNKRAGWLTALLLTVRYPQKYIFYRERLIKFAQTEFGYEMDENGSRGQRYVAYLALLDAVREQLAKSWNRPTDLIDAHSFLWVESATRERRDENPTDASPQKKRVWKISPGPTAQHWEMCRERKCIVIAFLDDLDFRSFPDTDAGKQALFDAGQGSQSANAILRFTHRMKPGDIVVANKGVNTVVGIGIILSDYIPPSDSGNPSQHPEYRHARRVDWLITEPLTFSKRLFVLSTVGRIFTEKWKTIKQAYLEKFPHLSNVFEQFERETMPDPPRIGELPELRELMSLSSITRNIILYGPPGTGKTYLVSEFATKFIEPQLKVLASTEGRRTRVLESLKWYEVIAVAMSMDGKSSFKVRELLNTEILKDFADLRKPGKITSVVWAQLGTHTSPESKTVNCTVKHEPYLFHKDSQSQWSLTTAGKEYVHENLGDALNQIKNPSLVATDASDFREFVTFHQSFAYEEFIEGLKPSVSDEGELTYEVRPGVFKQIAARAEAAWKKHGPSAPKYLLIIDEINRANIAKVFGELITLIEDDKRLGERNALELRLPYSGDKFGVPPNLYIVATMNTADRSIALLDLALRRRFSFVEVTPNPSLLRSVAGINLTEVLKKFNKKIELLLDRDHRIGHSYFMKVETVSDLHFAWFRRVLPLLQEYFYNDSERLYALLGDGFMRSTELGSLSRELSELVDTDSPRYEIKMLSEEELALALSEY